MPNLNAVGQTLPVRVYKPNQEVVFSLSGTYNMVVVIEVEVGSPGSDKWRLLKRFTTPNAAESFAYTSSGTTEIRLRIEEDTSGILAATFQTRDLDNKLTVGNMQAHGDTYNVLGGTITRLLSVPTTAGHSTDVSGRWTLWQMMTTEFTSVMDTNGVISSQDPALLSLLNPTDFIMSATNVDGTKSSGIFIVNTNNGTTVDLSNISAFGLSNTD